MSRQWRTNVREMEEEESMSEEPSSRPGGSEEASEPSSSGNRGQTGERSSVGPPPTYDGSRLPGAWEDFRLRARLWLKTTTIAPSSRGPRMLQQLSGRAFDTMKHMAEDDEWLESPDNGRLLLEEMGKPDRFGKEELESLWSSLHRLFYSRLKQSDDDILTFRNRFEEACRKVKRHGIELPQEALGFVYLRQSQIDDMTLERIVTITKGDLSLNSVIDAMRKLKMKLIQSEENQPKKAHTWLQSMADAEETATSLDGGSEVAVPLEDEEMEALEHALRDLEDEGSSIISGDNAKDILMNMTRQKVSRPVQQFNYKQVQNIKNDLKTGRGFRTPAVNGASGTRSDIQHLKSITRCRHCNQPGHWQRECPLKSQFKAGVQQTSNGAASSAQGSETTNKAWWSLSECMRDDHHTGSQE